jgi:hypothetical protein
VFYLTVCISVCLLCINAMFNYTLSLKEVIPVVYVKLDIVGRGR